MQFGYSAGGVFFSQVFSLAGYVLLLMASFKHLGTKVGIVYHIPDCLK